MEPTIEPTPTPEPAAAGVAPEPGGGEPVQPEVPAAVAGGEPPEPTPEPIAPEPPQYRMPGQQMPIDPAMQAEWYQQQYAAMANRAAQLQQQLEDIELQGMNDDDRARVQMQRQYEDMRAQMQQWEQTQQLQEWRNYLSQFAPQELQPQFSRMNDPVEMTHSVMVHQATQIEQLKRELATLQKAVQPTQAPRVTTGGGQPPIQNRGVLYTTPEERAAILQRRRLNLLTDEDAQILSI